MSIEITIHDEDYGDYKVQWHEFQMDNTNRTIIDDQYFGILNQTPQFTIREHIIASTAIGCWACGDTPIPTWCDNTQIYDIQNMADKYVDVLDGLSFQASDAFKFPQGMYRYETEEYRYMCDGIYQDLVKASVNIRGFGTCSCNIDDDSYYLALKCLEWIEAVNGCTVTTQLALKFREFIDRNLVIKADIQPGLVGDAISKVSVGSEQTIIPNSYKSRIESNTVGEITMDLKFTGKMFNASIRIVERTFFGMKHFL